jgi:hypothetical protein
MVGLIHLIWSEMAANIQPDDKPHSECSQLTAMKEMRSKGYQYAICGMSHPWGRRILDKIVDFIPIPDSIGSYSERL